MVPSETTVILAYHSDRLSVARDRFEVLGIRGYIKKIDDFRDEEKPELQTLYAKLVPAASSSGRTPPRYKSYRPTTTLEASDRDRG